METFLILLVVFAILALVIFISVAARKRCPPESKGDRGEKIVAQILGNTIIGEQYVINNLLFGDRTGQSCQIDHIFINRFGIWVIETKNYSGKIYGEEDEHEWTQFLGTDKEGRKFYNPIKQNATHIYCLKKYLNVKNVFHNVVVFLSNADVSHVSSNNVYTESELPSIKNQCTDVRLTIGEMEGYYNKLLQLQNRASISREEHIENIRRRQENIERGICPRCGGKLVLRNHGTEQFFGCSNFPACKFTKNIDK